MERRPRGSRSRRTRLATAGLVAAALSVAAPACKSDDATPATTTAAPDTAPTTAPPTTLDLSTVTTAPKSGISADEIAVRNVLDIYAAEFAAALDPPDPERAGLLEVMTGDFEAKGIELIKGAQSEGVTYRRASGGPTPHLTEMVEFETPTQAIAIECYIDDFVEYQGTTGQQLEDSVTSARFTTTVIKEADGVWRVSARERQDFVPGPNLCPQLV